ncbi:MAG: hypothetical protein ABH873_02805, partial [Candidatus Firestonebacteria bacterium]
SKDKLYNESVTHERNMLVEKRIEELDDILIESSLSRIWQFIEYDKRSFAVISASRKIHSKEKNKELYVLLKRYIRELGYGFVELKGGYKEEEGFVSEKSLFIPNIDKKVAIKIGSEYNQYSILYKDKNQFVEIGTNKNSSIGKTLQSFVKVGKEKNINLAKEAIKEFFSSLVKGSHRGKKFKFNLQEKEDIGLWGRMAGRKPEWIRID